MAKTGYKVLILLKVRNYCTSLYFMLQGLNYFQTRSNELPLDIFYEGYVMQTMDGNVIL